MGMRKPRMPQKRTGEGEERGGGGGHLPAAGRQVLVHLRQPGGREGATGVQVRHAFCADSGAQRQGKAELLPRHHHHHHRTDVHSTSSVSAPPAATGAAKRCHGSQAGSPASPSHSAASVGCPLTCVLPATDWPTTSVSCPSRRPPRSSWSMLSGGTRGAAHHRNGALVRDAACPPGEPRGRLAAVVNKTGDPGGPSPVATGWQ